MKDERMFDGAARIKVIGVGGAGGNAVNRMISANLRGVDFIAVNTDKQVLDQSKAHLKVNIGRKVTRGLGVGGDPQLGTEAAEESRQELSELVKDADMVFVTAGMGGGTGTGASPLIAQLARDAGALTIGVVSRPFPFEGRRRGEIAEEGLKNLREKVDALITIPNERLQGLVDKKGKFTDALRIADDVLRQGVQGISDIVTTPGLINVDFADVRAVMSEAGAALMGIGYGSGDTRAGDAARNAVQSPLLESSMDGARGILLNITGGDDLTMTEVTEASEIVRQAAHPEANIIFGVVIDDRMDGEVKITVIATGFGSRAQTDLFTSDPEELGRPVSTTFERPSFQADTDEIDIPAFLRNRA
ncbi:MAG: cell division protein FtsZ [Candidatus Dormibacteria bacterium]